MNSSNTTLNATGFMRSKSTLANCALTKVKQTRILSALLLALSTVACSMTDENSLNSAEMSAAENSATTENSATAEALNSFPHESFLTSGTIVISRSLPKVDTKEVLALRKEYGKDYGTLLGYVPLADNQTEATWLEYERSSGLLKLFHEGSLVKSLNTRGELTLPDGDYEVMSTAKNPLWYASDDYFRSRHLTIPAQGDISRYRSGALGAHAMFLDENVAVHSSVIWSREVGGLQLASNDLQEMLPFVAPGTPFVIKN